jgi:hypothetical protein
MPATSDPLRTLVGRCRALGNPCRIGSSCTAGHKPVLLGILACLIPAGEWLMPCEQRGHIANCVRRETWDAGGPVAPRSAPQAILADAGSWGVAPQLRALPLGRPRSLDGARLSGREPLAVRTRLSGGTPWRTTSRRRTASPRCGSQKAGHGACWPQMR